jgi:hypothetical protein
VGAPAVGAGVTAALADLAEVINRDLPGLLGDGGNCVLLALAQVPADGVDQLVAGPPRQLVQAGDEIVAGTGAVAGDHQPPPVPWRQGGNRLTQDRDVVGGRIGLGGPGAQHRGERLAGVVTQPKGFGPNPLKFASAPSLSNSQATTVGSSRSPVTPASV